MQPQNRNFLVTIVLCGAIFFGWQAFSNWMWPPAKKDAKPAGDNPIVAIDPAARAAAEKAAGFAAVPLATPEASSIWPLAALAAATAPTMPAAPVVQKPPAAPLAVGAAPAAAAEREVTLGDDDSFLKVVLTSRGAGVVRLTLNRFDAANRLGEPEKPKRPLELLPGDRGASYVLYHYEKPGDAQPVDTLGNLNWNYVPPTNPAEAATKAVFEATLPAPFGIKITKSFTLSPGDYHVGLSVAVARIDPTGTAVFRYQIAGPKISRRSGPPTYESVEGQWYATTYRNTLIGYRDAKDNFERFFEDAGQTNYTLGSIRYTRSPDVRFRYAGIAVQYFASVIVVDDQQPGGAKDFIEFVRATSEEPKDKFDPQHLTLNDVTVRTISEEIAPGAGAEVEHRYLLYNGPVKVRLLHQMAGVDAGLADRYESTLKLNTLTDYHSQTIPRWPGAVANTIGWTTVLIATTNFMHGVVNFLHQYIPSYGICIICLTIMVRGLLFPFSRYQVLSTQKFQAQMARLQPKIKEIQEKYKDDFQAQNRARTELMLKHGINPLAPMRGCLLLFAQMPIFMGLYYALQESVFFRLENFLWIKNLAAPDMLIWWGEGIPWISKPDDIGSPLYLGPFLNLLPIISTTLMLIHQSQTMPPAQDEQQEMQFKMMKIMSVVFGLFFYKVPAGLCLYFICSSLWGMAERKLLPKIQHHHDEESGGPDKGNSVTRSGLTGMNGPSRGAKFKKGKAGRASNTPAKEKGKLQLWLEKWLEEARKK